VSNYKLFKVYSEKMVYFSAYIANKNIYRVTEDFCSMYKDEFLDVINGKFRYEYINFNQGNRQDIKEFNISGQDCFKNLEKYIDFLDRFYDLKGVIKENIVSSYFEYKFIGSGFGYEEGMSSKNINIANSLMQETIKIANNIDYIGTDFIKERAGSFILSVETDKKSEKIIEF